MLAVIFLLSDICNKDVFLCLDLTQVNEYSLEDEMGYFDEDCNC